MSDEKKTQKVTSINEARKKKTDQKLKLAEIYRVLSDVIQRQPWASLPAFPEKYASIEMELGARVPALVSADGVVQVVRKEALANSIITYCDRQLAGRPEFTITMRQAREASEYYLGAATPIPSKEIKNVTWQGEGGYTYRKLPWARQTGDAPTWETLLARMSNAQAFIDWVGSLFVEESSLQNYVWVFGMGGDGKGSINRFMAKVFDKAYRTKQPPNPNHPDKFWTYGLIGARLVAFPDCDQHTFVARGLFKSLTGGDPVDVEAKKEMSFTTTLNAKYLILSQEKPAISSEKADLRRIIYCEMETCPAIDPSFEQKLWDEGGFFLSTCIEQYEQKYPNHGPIKTETEEVEGLVSTLEEPFEVAFDTWFEIDPMESVAPVYMQAVLTAEWPGVGRQYQKMEFVRWLERKHSVRKARLRNGDGRKRGYVGIKLRRIPPVVQDLLNNGPV